MTAPLRIVSEQAAIYRGPRSDEYCTPDWIWDPLNDQYQFNWDLAATHENAKCNNRFTANHSFLTHYMEWRTGVAWLNPPFSWAEKFCELLTVLAHFKGAQAVCIYKSGNMETRAWRHLFAGCSWIAHPHKRVNYVVDGVEQKGVQFASALIGFNVDAPRLPFAHTLLRVDSPATSAAQGGRE